MNELKKLWLELKKAKDNKKLSFFLQCGIDDMYYHFPKDKNALLFYFQDRSEDKLWSVLANMPLIWDAQKHAISQAVFGKVIAYKTTLVRPENMQSQFTQEKKNQAYDLAYLEFVTTLMLANSLTKK